MFSDSNFMYVCTSTEEKIPDKSAPDPIELARLFEGDIYIRDEGIRDELMVSKRLLYLKITISMLNYIYILSLFKRKKILGNFIPYCSKF